MSTAETAGEDVPWAPDKDPSDVYRGSGGVEGQEEPRETGRRSRGRVSRGWVVGGGRDDELE